MAERLTRPQFVRIVGPTEAHIEAAGLVVVECDCGDADCRGWATVTPRMAERQREEEQRKGKAPEVR